jgi:hypothetical protein
VEVTARKRSEDGDRRDRRNDEADDLRDRAEAEQRENAGDHGGDRHGPEEKQPRREDLSHGEQNGRNGPQQPGWHYHESYGVRASLQNALIRFELGTGGVGPRS